jgi:ABC-type polysaccharide/polyol phosphate export permease
LVFLLPVESGERTSFSFTLLLTLIVFMTMVSDRLPSSNDISIFNMYLLHQLMCSMCITSLTVFSIHLLYKDIHDTN